MAPERFSLPPVLVPLTVLLVACVAALALPFRMIEPDDDDFFYGMHAFARGKVVMTEGEARELHDVALPDTTKPRAQLVMGVRSPKGFIRERSPGHYALLALFREVGLDRGTNVVLAFAVVGFFYWFVRRHVDERGEVAVLASLLLIVNPTFLTMLYRVYMSDFDYFVWATVSLGLYFAARRARCLWLCAAAGLSLGLSVGFRHTNMIAFLVIATYELVAWRKCAWEQRAGGPAEAPAPFGWVGAAVLVGSVVAGAIPLLWYNHATTGELFGTGYQYRLERESAAYFALWDARAVFSLRHLFLGETHGFMSQGYTLSVGLARVLQGYPLLVLAPAGLLLLERGRGRRALFLALWLGLFWGVYLCYRTIRADSFQFMCRKLSPGLAPLAVGAAVALSHLPRKARYGAFAALSVVSLGVTAGFFVQFVAAERVGPGMGPGLGPRMGRPGKEPGGPERLPARGPREPSGPDERHPLDADAHPAELVRHLHGLMDQARRQGIDVSKARELDEASKEAARTGRWRENRRLLHEAIESVEEALGEQRPPQRPRDDPRPPRPTHRKPGAGS